MFGSRVAGGLLLGVLTLLLAPKAVANLDTFSLVIGIASLPVAAIVAIASARMKSSHYQWWQGFHADAGVVRYVVINTVTGTPIVAPLGFVGLFAAIALFMSP